MPSWLCFTVKPTTANRTTATPAIMPVFFQFIPVPKLNYEKRVAKVPRTKPRLTERLDAEKMPPLQANLYYRRRAAARACVVVSEAPTIYKTSRVPWSHIYAPNPPFFPRRFPFLCRSYHHRAGDGPEQRFPFRRPAASYDR